MIYEALLQILLNYYYYLVFNSITALLRKYTTEYIFNFMADNFMSSKIKIKIHFKG